jgi:uncharacterized coiled-coil protein SlyX
MKELFIKQRNEELEKRAVDLEGYVEQQITTDDVVEQIADAVTKLTTAATEQSKLLKLITDEILTLKSKVEKLEK